MKLNKPMNKKLPIHHHMSGTQWHTYLHNILKDYEYEQMEDGTIIPKDKMNGDLIYQALNNKHIACYMSLDRSEITIE